MSNRLNQYQRRQADRRLNALVTLCTLQAALLTALGVGVYYLLMHNSLNQAMYQTVLDSGGRVTFDQVAGGKLIDSILPILGAWFCLSLVLSVIATVRDRRQHSDFIFGDEVSVEAAPLARASRPRNLAKITPREFEEEVARLITARTGCKTQVVGGSGDRGADIKVFDQSHRLVGVVQCKRYRPGKALPPQFVREMVAVKQIHQVNIVYIATTTYFTTRSYREAEQLGIRLIDGRDLQQISRKVAAPEAQPAPALRPGASVVDRPLANARFRRPQRPMTEQERIQQQLNERRERLYNVGAPTVRQAPPAIRTTPGAENQYKPDAPSAPAPRNMQRPIPEPPPTKEMLRFSRDAQIRRKQSGKTDD